MSSVLSLVVVVVIFSQAFCLQGLVGVGLNTDGIVGDNTTKTEPLVLRSVQITKEALLGVSVKDVKVSSHFGLLLSKSGQVYTWGNNGGVGSLGRGHLDNAISGPVAVKRWSITGDTISAIAATDETAVIVDSDGKLYTWGGNQHGTLGTAQNGSCSHPRHVNATSIHGKIFVSISASKDYVLALTKDGLVYAWGENGNGQLGLGHTKSPQLLPVQVNITNVKSISAGVTHAVALKNDNTLWYWGLCGNSSLVPAPVDVGELRGKTINSVTAGNKQTTVIADGLLHAWGNSDETNALCTGSNRDTPKLCSTKILQGKIFSKVVANEANTFALTSDGHLIGWGQSSYHFGEHPGSSKPPTEINLSNLTYSIVDFYVGPYTLHVWDNSILGDIKDPVPTPEPWIKNENVTITAYTLAAATCGAFALGVIVGSVPVLCCCIWCLRRKNENALDYRQFHDKRI